MAANLSTEETEAVKQFLEEVNEKRISDNGPVSWNTGVKFVMARKSDVRRAVDLYRSHEMVRRREDLCNINPWNEDVRRELLTDKFTILSSRDDNGAAIALFTAKLHHPELSSQQSTLKGLVFQLDTALESFETQRNGLVFIYDMSSSKYNNFDYDLSIKILSMLKGSYPARLKKVLIVTAPLWFKAPFKIIRLFVREKLRERVYIADRSQLYRHIPLNALPRRLGGKLDADHKEWICACLQSSRAKSNLSPDSDFSDYFENCNNIMYDSVTSSLSSPGSFSLPSSANSRDNSVFFSDQESESSRGTIQEKHNHEYKEKEIRIENQMDTSDDSVSSPTSPTATNADFGPALPCKRGPTDANLSKEATKVEPAQIQSPRKRRAPAGAGWEPSIHLPDIGELSIKELMDYTAIKGRKGLCKAYDKIKAEPPAGTFEASKARANLPKNRYTDVLCLDHSRVKLKIVDDEPYSDYINANFVDGYKHKSKYISTQGPLTRTFADFWRMVWEQMVLLVVMTTRTVERSRLKCGQYWPNEEETDVELGDFIIINNGIDARQDYNVTSLILQNTKTGESREVTHFQFTSWPDYGVPKSAEAFLNFMFHVREKQAERTRDLGSEWTNHLDGPPIVIHCSAGIGRTGTFITMDICTRRLADIGTVDVNTTVRKIRTQRAFSIQMPDQYVFCHLALIEHAQNQGLLTEINLDGFDDSSSESD